MSNAEMNNKPTPVEIPPGASVLVIGPAREHDFGPTGAVIPKRLMINKLNTCSRLEDCLRDIFRVSPAVRTQVRKMNDPTRVSDTDYIVLEGEENLVQVGVNNGDLLQLFLLD